MHVLPLLLISYALNVKTLLQRFLNYFLVLFVCNKLFFKASLTNDRVSLKDFLHHTDIFRVDLLSKTFLERQRE